MPDDDITAWDACAFSGPSLRRVHFNPHAGGGFVVLLNAAAAYGQAIGEWLARRPAIA
jgi:hypothetical protein